MFLHTVSDFGPHTKHTIYHPDFKSSFSIVPNCGGYLSELQLPLPDKNKVFNIIEAPNTYEEWQEDVYCKSAWLLPFPNRLKNGQYRFEGIDYQFPIDDTNCNNAIHGFIADQKMFLQKIVLTPSFAEVILEYVYEGDLAYYPFPFHLQISYLLMENQLIVETKINNIGRQKIPIGIGFHPYFQLPSLVKNMELQLPACQRIEVDKQMIPTGKKVDFPDFEESKKIGVTSFDTGFKTTSIHSDTHKIYLKDLQNKLQLTYFQDKAFPFFQLYIPPHRKSIAIEPMSCNIDAFNNGDGLTLLEAGKIWTGGFGVALSEL